MSSLKANGRFLQEAKAEKQLYKSQFTHLKSIRSVGIAVDVAIFSLHLNVLVLFL